MRRIYLGFVLIATLLTGALGSSHAQVPDKDAELTRKVKASNAKIGSGKDARVVVELKNGTKLTGTVSEIKADSFVVVDKTGRSTDVNYSEVRQSQGYNRALGKHIAIGAGVVGFLLVITILVAERDLRSSELPFTRHAS